MVKMKDSGIEWIGEIPETWEVVKGKYLFTQRSSKGNEFGLTLLSPTQKYGVVPQSMYEKVTGMKPVKIDRQKDLNLFKTIHKGDFCISLRSFEGGFEYSFYEGVVSPAYQVFYRIDNNSIDAYYKYLFKDKTFIDKMNSYTMSLRDGKNIAFNDFGNTYITVPPKSEQQQIADFLDYKTAEIDELIDKINTEIDTLKQYQSSIITQAVTKGLDPNVPMKDSRIEWIGEIPETWRVVPLYKYFSERKNKNRAGNEKNLLSLSYGNIIRKNIEAKGGLLPESFTTYNIIEPGDVIIRPTDLQNDKRSLRTGLSNERGIITSAYIDLAPERGTNSRYYHYLLHSYDIQKVFYNMGNGVRQGLNYSEFSKLRVLVPERIEQQQIADYLDNKVSKIQNIIKSKQQQITELTEYKNSLIFEYVTGKKQVKEAN